MIAFSGIDCSGKSTQTELICKHYSDMGIKCKIIHSRGGYTPMLELFKNIIRSKQKGAIREQNEYRASIHQNNKKRKLLLWLSIADLALYYGIYFRVIEMFGTKILADRYFWDTYIDFNMKYPDDAYTSWRIWRITQKIYLKPELSIIYTIPAELSMYRSELKDEPWPEPKEVREYRISRYMEEIENNRWDCVINSTGTIEDVYQSTIQRIDKCMKR